MFVRTWRVMRGVGRGRRWLQVMRRHQSAPCLVPSTTFSAPLAVARRRALAVAIMLRLTVDDGQVMFSMQRWHCGRSGVHKVCPNPTSSGLISSQYSCGSHDSSSWDAVGAHAPDAGLARR